MYKLEMACTTFDKTIFVCLTDYREFPQQAFTTQCEGLSFAHVAKRSKYNISLIDFSTMSHLYIDDQDGHKNNERKLVDNRWLYMVYSRLIKTLYCMGRYNKALRA